MNSDTLPAQPPPMTFSNHDNSWGRQLTNGWAIYKPGHGEMASGLTQEEAFKRLGLSGPGATNGGRR